MIEITDELSKKIEKLEEIKLEIDDIESKIGHLKEQLKNKIKEQLENKNNIIDWVGGKIAISPRRKSMGESLKILKKYLQENGPQPRRIIEKDTGIKGSTISDIMQKNVKIFGKGKIRGSSFYLKNPL